MPLFVCCVHLPLLFINIYLNLAKKEIATLIDMPFDMFHHLFLVCPLTSFSFHSVFFTCTPLCVCVYDCSVVSWDSKGVFSFLNVKCCFGHEKLQQGGDWKKK